MRFGKLGFDLDFWSLKIGKNLKIQAIGLTESGMQTTDSPDLNLLLKFVFVFISQNKQRNKSEKKNGLLFPRKNQESRNFCENSWRYGWEITKRGDWLLLGF